MIDDWRVAGDDCDYCACVDRRAAVCAYRTQSCLHPCADGADAGGLGVGADLSCQTHVRGTVQRQWGGSMSSDVWIAGICGTVLLADRAADRRGRRNFRAAKKTLVVVMSLASKSKIMDHKKHKRRWENEDS